MKIGIVGTRKDPTFKQQKEIQKSLRKSLRTKNTYITGDTFGVTSFVVELLAFKKKEITLVKSWIGKKDMHNHYLDTFSETLINMNIPEDVVPSGSVGLSYRATKEMNEQIIKLSDKVFIFTEEKVGVITMDAIQKCNLHSKQYYLINMDFQNDIII